MASSTSTKLTFSFSSKKKKPTTSHLFALDEFQNDESPSRKKQRMIERTEPLVIPLQTTDGLTILERKHKNEAVKTQDELAAEALTQSAMNHLADKETDALGGTTNFSAQGDLVISSGQNVNLVVTAAAAATASVRGIGSFAVDKDKEQFQKQLEALPEEADPDSYERVPIAEFGAALLRGMGWKGESSSSGRDDPLAPSVRPHRLGLGATPKLMEISSSRNSGRMRTAGQVKKDEQLQKQQADYEKQRQERLAQDKQQKIQMGSIVRVANGVRAKLLKTSGVPGLNRVLVQLEGEQTKTAVKKGDIALVERSELTHRPFRDVSLVEDTPEKQYMGTKEDDSHTTQKQEKPQKNYRGLEHHRRGENHKDDSKIRVEDHSDDKWLIPNIRVRVISKKLGLRHLKEKGVVVDVTHRGEATLQMSNGQVLDRVPERYLETALPKAGGNAVVLMGKAKFLKGKLLERDSRSGMGVIQFFEDMSVLKLSLDDMAEWVGPLDDDIME